jgi:hypothetical protein
MKPALRRYGADPVDWCDILVPVRNEHVVPVTPSIRFMFAIGVPRKYDAPVTEFAAVCVILACPYLLILAASVL